jgi:hypothetical protein
VSLDGQRWVACRPGFFLPVRVLSRHFRNRFLDKLAEAHRAGKLRFFGEHQYQKDANNRTENSRTSPSGYPGLSCRKTHHSNPHSQKIVSRGFLPQGLSDACPLSVWAG